MTGQPHAPSYYAATAHPQPDCPALKGRREADVCVVGGGFTGVQAALELAERGFSVVLLEARRIGWGASGRNGGQICSGLSADMSKVEKWVGLDDARKIFAATEEGKAIIRERVIKHAIDCDLAWGYFHAAERAREMAEVEAWHDHWRETYGVTTLSVARGAAEARRHVASDRYIGGLFDAGAGHLHPLNYCLGLARAAALAGVEILEGSAVTAVAPGVRPLVKTAEGEVSAAFVVLGCNAYLEGLEPALRAKIMPVGTYIGATEVLGENRAGALIPGNAAIADLKFVLDYFRRSADHRLLFGGRVSYTTREPADLKAAMRASMLRVFPELGDVAMDYAWGGFVAITMERTPHLGRIGSNIYFAQGYSGSGVTLCGMAARILAEAIAGQAARLDLFSRLPHTTFPGGPLLRTPTLALAMLWYRLRDLLP
jgi:gamma-glutamylputrescine oxidase